tara:strand:+ start:6526 stop:6642 length:117 start_codon:yes stop_codon:yes gene_type:complete
MSLEILLGFAISSAIIIPYEPVVFFILRKLWKMYRSGC